MALLSTLLYIVFILAAIVLIVVILLQEGKGGGFGEALGAGGRETFGVGSSGINTFTAVTAAIFLGSAILIHKVNQAQLGSSVLSGESLEQGPGPGATPALPPAPTPGD